MFKNNEFLGLVWSNAVVIVGRFWLHWDMSSLMFYFFIETILIGIFALKKVPLSLNSDYIRPATSKDIALGRVGRKRTTDCWIFLAVFIPFMGLLTGAVFGYFGLGITQGWGLVVSLSGSVIWQVYMYYTYYLARKEYEHTTFGSLFIEPYKRMVLSLFISIFSLGAMSDAKGTSATTTGLIDFFIILKCVGDFWMYSYIQKYSPRQST